MEVNYKDQRNIDRRPPKPINEAEYLRAVVNQFHFLVLKAFSYPESFKVDLSNVTIFYVVFYREKRSRIFGFPENRSSVFTLVVIVFFKLATFNQLYLYNGACFVCFPCV